MTTNKTVRIGTRGSQLALWQAETVKETLQKAFPQLEVVINIIHTKGDKILDVALSKIGDKGLFTKEIEVALLEGEADIAVHSLKDLPTVLPEGLKLGAVLERGEYRDALVSRDGKRLGELTRHDTIATSSLRRVAGLRRINPNFQIKDIRGNVNTRLRKMEEGYCDAMIMAAAGLQRLGLDRYITEIIEPTTIIPAVSQGIVAIETRENDPFIDEICAAINNAQSWIAATAERTFLNKLEGGCQVPMGCYSKQIGHQLTLTGFVASLDGKTYLESTTKGSTEKAAELGMQLAEELMKKGALDILADIRKAQ